MATPAPALVGDRVVETTSTNGTGTITLNGAAASGLRAFSQEFSDGDPVYYLIEDNPDSPTEFELGIGTFNTGASNTISRDTVLQSSSGSSKISLASGTTYTVTNTWPADAFSGRRVVLDDQLVAASVGSVDLVDSSGLSIFKYEIDISQVAIDTAGTNVNMTFSTDGGSSFFSGSTDYGSESTRHDEGGNSSTISFDDAGAIRVMTDVNSGGQVRPAANLQIFSPNGTPFTMIDAVYRDDTNNKSGRDVGSGRIQNSSITGIDAIRLTTGGNFTDGRFRLWGILA